MAEKNKVENLGRPRGGVRMEVWDPRLPHPRAAARRDLGGGLGIPDNRASKGHLEAVPPVRTSHGTRGRGRARVGGQMGGHQPRPDPEVEVAEFLAPTPATPRAKAEAGVQAGAAVGLRVSGEWRVPGDPGKWEAPAF